MQAWVRKVTKVTTLIWIVIGGGYGLDRGPSLGSKSSSSCLRSNFSVASVTLMNPSTSFASSLASAKQVFPEATAASIAAMAAPASAAERNSGRANIVGRSRRGGRIRSRQRRNAIESPASARSIALRVSASASPSSNASAARVARWRAPLGLPAGFPDRPFAKGRPR